MIICIKNNNMKNMNNNQEIYIYYTFTHKKPFEEYKIKHEECYLTNYLLYVIKDKLLLDKLP